MKIIVICETEWLDPMQKLVGLIQIIAHCETEWLDLF